ncbi:hypothetical protein FZEAL_4516 [Fusarium zealandicum]|uniref:Uncharacterized protein n=1 Tax=Fusarium zealandicum TaxID=1053134 RepID=A0A8H4ULP9_9HYPO|nr:hypothetical protein FZEAL_4516 [Fusarium zealandicum]
MYSPPRFRLRLSSLSDYTSTFTTSTIDYKAMNVGPENVLLGSVILFYAHDQSGRDDGAPPKLERRGIVIRDLRSTGFPEAWDEKASSWREAGIKVIKLRHLRFSSIWDEEDAIEHHQHMVATALKRDLLLKSMPSCLDITIQFGTSTSDDMDFDTYQMDDIEVNTIHEQPSSMIRMDPTPDMAEELLQRHYGEMEYKYMMIAYCGWEIVEQVPSTFAVGASPPIEDYPHIICDPRTLDVKRDTVVEGPPAGSGPFDKQYLRFHSQQQWFCMSRQWPFELLVRRVASSGQIFESTANATVPMVILNTSGDASAVAENRVTMRFVIWHPKVPTHIQASKKASRRE